MESWDENVLLDGADGGSARVVILKCANILGLVTYRTGGEEVDAIHPFGLVRICREQSAGKE